MARSTLSVSALSAWDRGGGLTVPTVRFIRAHEFRERLRDYSRSFLYARQNIHDIVMAYGHGKQADIHGRVERVSSKQDHLSEEMQQLRRSVDAVLDRLCAPRSDAEKEVRDYIDRARSARRDVSFDDVARLLEERNLSPTIITDTMRRAATRDLDALLRENLGSFERKLDGAQKTLQEVWAANAEILKHVRDGAHRLVDDEDVRKVWEEAKWGLAVDCRHFGEGASALDGRV
jgi:hypothetical protein